MDISRELTAQLFCLVSFSAGVIGIANVVIRSKGGSLFWFLAALLSLSTMFFLLELLKRLFNEEKVTPDILIPTFGSPVILLGFCLLFRIITGFFLLGVAFLLKKLFGIDILPDKGEESQEGHT
ncbi:MAG: hypothetical protein COA78_30155 [Blastopirellula sp.]|nr:MAG: hypothetical protein COA78_30155 [Blastopirellula sp.]